MTESLSYILQLEDSQQFELAFNLYSKLYSNNKFDYEIWKHFYFFLWSAPEETPDSFQQKIDSPRLLLTLFNEGQENFFAIPDYNFITGYTICIFPYLYGECDEMEKEAQRLLLKSTELEPSNSVYKLSYLGSNPPDFDQQSYIQAKADAADTVIDTFSGPGLLNKYFRHALYRL